MYADERMRDRMTVVLFRFWQLNRLPDPLGRVVSGNGPGGAV